MLRSVVQAAQPGRASNCRWRARICAAAGIVIVFSAWGCRRSASQFIDRGNQLFGAGKYQDASINYRNAIQRDPRNSEAYYRLALALLRLNKPAEAFQDLNHAVELNPQNIPAKVDLAGLSLTAYAQDPRRPAALYNRASELTGQLLAANPNSVDGLRLKAGIALIDNKPGEAVALFRRALQLSPGAAEIQTGLAGALLRDNQPADGEREAKEVIARHPDFTPAYGLLLSQYVSQQRWSDAESLLKLRIANSPKDPVPIVQLAGFYSFRRQPEEAEKQINSLLDRRAAFPQADLLAGDFHAQQRDLQKALADYQRGLSSDKARQATYQERSAAVLAMLGRRDEALKAAEAILAKDRANIIARALKITILLGTGGAENLKTASTLAAPLAKDAPRNPSIQMLTGQAALAGGDLDAAIARFQQAAAGAPRSTAPRLAVARVYLLRRNYSAVLQQADAALQINPNDENARLMRIVALTGTGSYALAKSEAQQLGRETSNPRRAQMQLGIIEMSQKHYAQAEAYFQKLYKEDASDLNPLVGLVSSYVAENAPDRALQLLESETKRAPGSIGTEALLAATAEAAGKPDLALSELQTLAAKAPKSAELQIRIGELERKQGNLPAALSAFERARQLAPDRPGMDAIVASVEAEMGQPANAIASYRKALAKTPDNPAILNNVAFLLAETDGDLKEALQMATAALRKAPDNVSVQDTLAWIHVKQGDLAGALPTLSSLVRKSPNDPTFRYHYATALLKSGDRAQAKQQLEAALAMSPPQALDISIRMMLAQVH